MSDIIVEIGELREQLKTDAEKVVGLKKHDFFKFHSSDKTNQGEMFANIMLSYRALEDARMRLGKVIQAYEGGESVYDKPEGTPVANIDISRNEGESSV